MSIQHTSHAQDRTISEARDTVDNLVGIIEDFDAKLTERDEQIELLEQKLDEANDRIKELESDLISANNALAAAESGERPPI